MENSNTYTKENSNTYTKVQNLLISALCQVKATERLKRKKSKLGVNVGILQTVLAICRLTIGFHLDERFLTDDQIAGITGFKRGRQHEHLQRALKLNMITRYDSSGESEINKKPKYVYSVNFDPFHWRLNFRNPERCFDIKEAMKKLLPIKGASCSQKREQKLLPIKGAKF